MRIRVIRGEKVYTGQHYDANMSQVFCEELALPRPDVNLEVGSGSPARQTALIYTVYLLIMQRFEPVLLEYNPDWVIVPGDVNSTLACALVASKLGVKVAHVEAELRSFDRTMLEEIKRVVTEHGQGGGAIGLAFCGLPGWLGSCGFDMPRVILAG